MSAAKLDGRVLPPTIAARARRLRALGDRKHAEFARRFDGAAAELLVESTRDRETGALRGYTRNYLRATLAGPDTLIGRRVRVRLAVDPDAAVRATADA